MEKSEKKEEFLCSSGKYSFIGKLKEKPFKYIYRGVTTKHSRQRIEKIADIDLQNCVSESWRKLIDRYFEGKLEKFSFKPKKDFRNEKIIWQYWGTGWDSEKLPDIVKVCRKSVERYKKDYTVVRLDDENIDEYIEVPEFVLKKKKEEIIKFAFYADIIRLILLATYGGIWLDATVLMTGEVKKELTEKEYFVFQRLENVENPSEWEKHNLLYFDWNRKNRVKVLNSIIFSRKGNRVIRICMDLLLNYWKAENRIPHYFFFQILYSELTENELKNEKCEVIDDRLPHLLIKSWDDSFSEEKFQAIRNQAALHKLTYKTVIKKDSFGEYIMNSPEWGQK